MLNLVDDTIRKVLETWPPPGPPRPEIFFDVPDDAWQTRAGNGNTVVLNVYMYELRENREFRRAEFDVLELPDRSKVLSRPPVYVDSHYLISAWSPTDATDQTTPIPEEHAVLGKALQVLVQNPDVVPATLGVVGGGVVFEAAHIYLTVAPPEPARILNEFWSTMKVPWRPAIQLVATAPVDLLQDEPLDGVVITLIQRYAVPPAPAGQVAPVADEWILVGGWVLNAADQDKPIEGASVVLVATGEEVRTDRQGRFILTRLRSGRHRLRASAAGMTAVERDLDVLNALPAEHVFRLAP